MANKSLIMYSSWTGNTEKVALRFKEVFEKKGWECDLFKVDENTDPENPPYDYSNYDFLCVGSPVVAKKPLEELIRVLEKGRGSAWMAASSKPEQKKVLNEKFAQAWQRFQSLGVTGPSRTTYSFEDKKGIVFVTHAGEHIEPYKEAEPALVLLACLMEHFGFQCVGQFPCPASHGKITSAWFKDLPNRPHARDLLKAEIFLEETIEIYCEP